MIQGASFPDFHHQPVRVGLQADREIGRTRGFEHDPAYAFSRLGDANPLQTRVSNFNGLAEHAGCQRSIVKVDVDPLRRAQAVGLVLHFTLHINNHRARVGRRNVEYARHQGPRRMLFVGA